MSDSPFALGQPDRPGRTTKVYDKDRGEVVEKGKIKGLRTRYALKIPPQKEVYHKMTLPTEIPVERIKEVDEVESVEVSYVVHDVTLDEHDLRIWADIGRIEGGVAHLEWHNEEL